MEYMRALKDLRSRMDNLAVGKEPSIPAQGYVPQRPMSQPEKTGQDILAESQAWLSEIRDQAAKARREAPKPSGSFAEGFASTYSRRPKKRPEVVETQEEKDAKVAPLIARRGERPSNYAPDENISEPGRKFVSKSAFVDELYPKAIEIGAKIGVDPRIIMAQAALETGWGKSAPRNNFFGVKSHGQKGGKVSSTLEEVNGQMVRINDSFRTYKSPQESFEDYGNFLATNDRYLPVLAAGDLESQIEALGNSGYATDSKYASKIRSIVMNLPDPKDYI